VNNDTSPTAALILIGNELLSGRTQDKNLAFIGSRLAARGIVLSEARVIADVPGPTHDDITADCVAKAFGVELPIHPEAEYRLLAYFKSRDVEPNADRMRMARIPVGATLIDNPVSIAPGFRLENVIVMAGVPRIMQSMFDNVEKTLPMGPSIDSISVLCDLAEGTFASDLRDLQTSFDDLDVGSYPMSSEDGRRVALVAKGQSQASLSNIKNQLEQMVVRLGGQVFPAD